MTTEVEQSKLNIHVLNQNQYEGLPSVSDTELYIVDPQFQGQKFLGTDEEGEIVEKDALQGVQVNGTDLTPDANNKVNIPVASTTGFGVSTINNTYGIGITASGELRTSAASEAEIQSKSNTAKPLVPKTVDVVIREGLGNYDTTKGVWTDEYKEHACDTIGAAQTTEIVDWIES